MSTKESIDTVARNKQHAKILARAWADPDFQQQLMANPKEIFRAEGIEVPDEVKLNVLVDNPEHINLVLSDQPRAARPRTSDGTDDIYALLTVAYNRALTDADFKERLIANPNAALGELGATLPENIKFTVHSETTHEHFFTVPLLPKVRVKLKMRSELMQIGDEDAPASASMLLKSHPDTKPTNVNVNVNVDVNTQAAVNVNGVTNVNVAAAAAAVTVAVAVVVVKVP
jgi:hypothetical protein